MIDFENGIIVAGGFRIDKNTKSRDIQKYFGKQVKITPREYKGMIIGYKHCFHTPIRIDENFSIERIDSIISDISVTILSALSELETTVRINQMLEDVPTYKPTKWHEYTAHWICSGCCIRQDQYPDGQVYIDVCIPAHEMGYLRPIYQDLPPQLQETVARLLHEDQAPE